MQQKQLIWNCLRQNEYDAPIVHYFGKYIDTAYANPELLKGFYSVLKEMDTLLELVFLTGVSKFAKTGIFSGLSNLVDIGQSTLDFDSFDLEDNRLFGLLYQTGYLTIQSRDEFGQYTLDYPNREVKNAMLAYLFEAFGGVSKGTGVSMAIKLERAFIADDLE